MVRNNLLFLFFILVLSAPKSWGASINDATFGLSSLTNYVGKVQTDKEGHTRKFEFSPFFSATMKWFIYDKFSLIPELGMGLPEKGVDKNIQRFHYQILTNLGYNYKDLLLTFGMGLAFTRLTSSGGEELLENGLGYTNFYLPSHTSTSRNFIFTLGADYIVFQGWGATAKLITYNLTDKSKRAFSYLVGVNYHFGQFDWGF